jgi:primosomal protein N' (replication factor Y)
MFGEEKFPPSSFAAVAVTIPAGPQGVLTYRIPEALRTRLCPGMRVLVSVGRRKITGIVTATGVANELPHPEKVKDILDILDEEAVFPHDLMRLWQWASGYYLASPGEMLGTILPGGLRSESTTLVKLNNKQPKAQSPQRGEAPSLTRGLQLTAVEQEILAVVAEKKRVPIKTLRRRFPEPSLGKALQRLEALEMLGVSEHLPRRKTLQSVTPTQSEVEWSAVDSALVGEEERPSFSLSTAQEGASAQVVAAVRDSAFRVFLLHGVTGSGKTAVYLQAAQATVERGRSVLILVPEIALTYQLLAEIRRRFGALVAVLHSAQVASERWAEWRRVARGEATVVVGVRSAVFAPLARLGLIVVDEEHDTAYKQEEGVRYNARDIAVVRGKISSCPVILGSATPSLESYTHSRTHRYSLIELPERVTARSLPTVEIVDLRQHARTGSADKIFSAALRQALTDNYQAGKQSLLFLNRRGYSSYLQCRLCGEAVSCTRCSVTLTWHLQGSVLRCHYCGFARQAPDHCPQCREPTLEGGGVGTEQVEEALKSFLPAGRVARLDRDSVSRRGALDRVLKAWGAHEIDVLIGTQMVTKGHDVPDVTLVGVLLADVSLNLPDFRAAERTFQLLTQVAGRAGRGQEPGRVIIQTYAPQHYSIRCAARHDFPRFATQELRYRKRLGYPPFTRVVNLRLEGQAGEKVRACAEHLAHHLLANAEGGDQAPVILGPAPAPIERLKGRDRWQVLLKGADPRILHALVRKAREEMRRQGQLHDVRLIVDVDPYNML